MRHCVSFVVLAVSTFLLLVPGRAEAQCGGDEGDLVYGAGWYAWFAIPNYSVGITMAMATQDGCLLDSQSGQGSHEAEVTVSSEIRPRKTARPVNMWGDVYYRSLFQAPGAESAGFGFSDDTQFSGWGHYASFSDEYIVPGAGPESVKLQFDAFIPYAWMGMPLDTSPGVTGIQTQVLLAEFLLGFKKGVITEADERSFVRIPLSELAPTRLFGETARAAVSLEVWNSAIKDQEIKTPVQRYVPLSQTFEAGSSLTDWENACYFCIWQGQGPWTGGGVLTLEAMQDNTVWDFHQKLNVGVADLNSVNGDNPERLGMIEGRSHLRIHCKGDPYFPLHEMGPFIAVDFEFVLLIKFGELAAAWEVSGCRDRFPAFEGYLFESVTMYNGSDSGNPFDMGDWCGQPFSNSGIVFSSGGSGGNPAPIPESDDYLG